LVDTFEPVVQEEGRHILFFVNWLTWHRRNLTPWRRLLFEAKVLSAWAFLIWERIGIARGIDSSSNAKMRATPQDNNFVFTGSKLVGNQQISAAVVIEVCLSEHERRFAGYDSRLLRPTLMPRVMRFAQRFMKG
ncbi:MAG TPA: ferritin-like domain-containing protein, partial [Stellaceae bacterium]|nr:ferritin-like domain-containing protein [Stellaceae bacterium]